MLLTKISGGRLLARRLLNRHLEAQLSGNQLFSTQPEVAPVLMPALSPTMTNGTIAAWRKKPGDELRAGDVLCDIETDKASVGLEVQDDGVLAKILVEAHSAELPVGVAIALTVEDSAAYEAFLKMSPKDYSTVSATSAPSSAQTPPATAASNDDNSTHSHAMSTSGPQRFSPAARHIIESKSLNAQAIKGTAKNGLVSKADVINAINSGTIKPDTSARKVPATPAAAVSAPAAPVVASHAPVATPSSGNHVPVNNKFTDIPASNMRKIIGKRLTESKATVPHFYTTIECEIDELMSLRKMFKKDFGVTVSVNDLVIKSAALALRDVPEVNAKYNPKTNTIVPGNGAVDISVAVATPNGLITPILTGADKRGLVDISSTVRDLAARARDGKLKPEEFQGGSFSISNLGMYGISAFSAVINPPQAAILAVGAGITKISPPKAGGDGKPRTITTMTVQLSSDRRVVDEATAGQFLQVFQKYLSNPKTIML